MSTTSRVKPKPIIIVQGAQWGSEAKGMVAAALCERRNVKYAVRTGAVNAGHTVYYQNRAYKMQQLPTGWVNDDTEMVIGPGAYVNPAQLGYEVELLLAAGWHGQVYIDSRAGLHLPIHTERAGQSGRHYAIGATGKGCSEAIVDRIRLRGNGGQLFRDWLTGQWVQPWMEHIVLGDSAELLHRAYDRGDQILLEGTQGTLLDLYLGPYPYTTHKQCTAAQWVVEAGLSPQMEYETVLVARTFPIRVAGNSGPMSNEIDWPTLTQEINQKLILDGKPPMVNPDAVAYFVHEWVELGKAPYASKEVEASERNRDAWHKCPPDIRDELAKLWEFTTVTKKLRRVARMSLPDLKYSVMLNRPSWLCLTFLNYEFPGTWSNPLDGPPAGYKEYMDAIESATGAKIGAITVGPTSGDFVCWVGGCKAVG